YGYRFLLYSHSGILCILSTLLTSLYLNFFLKDIFFPTPCQLFLGNALFSTAMYTKQYDFAKEIIERIPAEEMSQSKILSHFKILCQIEDNPEASEFIIDQNKFQGAEAAEVINIANTALIAKGEFTSIPEKVENALKYDANNEETLEIGVAAALLNNNTVKAKEYLNQLNEEKQQEIASNYSKDNSAENIEELVEQYDPKEIHAQYQRIKQQKLFEISQKIINNQNNSNWEINKQKVTKDDVTFIGKYKGLNCFAKIAEKIKDKLDNNLITSFTKALEKGITYCKTSINGVKFLQNKAVEVKIDGDMRLFTDIIYKNSDAELLIEFDHYGRHDEAENFANSHKLEIIGDLGIA
ncbi:MAG TPA: hypothetical protein LFW21_00025, partial [Rickettsia endosymbiont of Pyrocoelia pectoralis]|nr:hypothetical protein [Rickettsia endosymbiont of Pyrocoelia pectoralis]